MPQLKEVTTNFLVVDGFINSGVGPTSFSLSRTTPANTNAKILRETKATVRVEGKLNTVGFALTETSPGIYTHPQLTLSVNDQYRVNIKTSSGKVYVSDYSAVRFTPNIDSIPWRIENGGVQLYADTHDDKVDVGYYSFRYDQTYEFVSRWEKTLTVFKNAQGVPNYADFTNKFTRAPDSTLYRCWKYDTLYNINIYSTEKLVKNRVSMYPLVFFDSAAIEIGIRYSMHLKMNAVSKEHHQFLEALKKNTQQLGSVFDAQPSDNNGNIHCINNPDERVIGFVEVTEEKDMRIFIRNSQLPVSWGYVYPCNRSEVENKAENLQWYREDVEMVTEPAKVGIGGEIISVYIAPRICVDCTMRGVNKRPVFW